MKRGLSAALVLGWAVLLCARTMAVGEADIVRAFVHDGTLYAYIDMEGMEQPVTRAEAKIGGQSFPASGQLETVRQAGAPVTWMLLVDNSNSMPAFRQEAVDFAESLAQSSGENTRFILAAFGDAFSVVREDVPAGELTEELAAIPMDERVTRLHTAIGAALDYFESQPRGRSELRCMVILSDAVQYDPAGGIPYEKLLERVGRSDVMLYSVGFGDDREALDRLGCLANASGGFHQVVGVSAAAAAAGAALTDGCGELAAAGFDLSGCTAPAGEAQISITFASGGELICRAETQVELPEMPEEAGPSGASELPGAADSPEQAELVQETPSADGIVLKDMQRLWPAIATAGTGIFLTVMIGVLYHRKKRAQLSLSAAGQACRGIYVRLELVRGELAGGETELELEDELIFGADPACAITLQGEGILPRHARAFLSEGAIYLEDLCPSGGIQVNGAVIEGPRRLRSGDEISVGTAAVRLKF